MTFGEHLEELRRRLIRSVLALLLSFTACMFYYEPLVRVMTRPHFQAMKMSGVPQEGQKLLAGTYPGPFFVMLKLAFIVGCFLASPIVAYQLWAFVAAGLYPRERRTVLAFAIPSFALFVGGCAFGYFVLLPYGLYGMASMSLLDIVSPTYTFSDYLNLVMLLTLILGAVFELPLVMVFFSRVGLVDPSVYSKWRKFAIVAIFIVAAVLTPPDVFSQLLMAGPLLVLYEIGVIFSRILARPRMSPA